jgi:hypothetical protein
MHVFFEIVGDAGTGRACRDPDEESRPGWAGRSSRCGLDSSPRTQIWLTSLTLRAVRQAR